MTFAKVADGPENLEYKCTLKILDFLKVFFENSAALQVWRKNRALKFKFNCRQLQVILDDEQQCNDDTKKKT